jgi:hypothetical protein
MSLGRLGESVACFNESLRRNPLAPNSCLLALGLIEYLETNYGQSAIALSRMSPSYIQKYCSLAAACGQLGHEDAARAAVHEFRCLAEERPSLLSVAETKDWHTYWRLAFPYVNQKGFEHMLEGIGKAGLPV